MLHIFGREKVCIDDTHGLNSYQYQLYSLVVIDEYGNGIPVAYCFSNRSDTYVMKIFFQNLKISLNYPEGLCTKVLMTDDDPTFVNAWSSFMGLPEKHLLCSWYISKNWLQHLNSIRDFEKQKIVREIRRINCIVSLWKRNLQHTLKIL